MNIQFIPSGKELLANELADKLDAANDHGYCRDAAIMIRQQAAEIESLKDKLMLAKQSLAIVEGWVKK